MASGRGQCREDGQRLEAIEVVRARLLMDVQAVGDKHEFELRRLSQLRLLLIKTEIHAGVG
ncbi:hypothetical protein D3C85_1512650 [compost metagenome]